MSTIFSTRNRRKFVLREISKLPIITSVKSKTVVGFTNLVTYMTGVSSWSDKITWLPWIQISIKSCNNLIKKDKFPAVQKLVNQRYL